jgi:hypothetical protein
VGLLFGGAESVDHRTDHGHAKRHDPDAIGAGGFLRPDEALGRSPASAAVFDRPGRGDPALFGQDAVPREEILFVQLVALILLAAQCLGVVVGNESANFLAEGDLFWAELKVHGSILSNPWESGPFVRHFAHLARTKCMTLRQGRWPEPPYRAGRARLCLAT